MEATIADSVVSEEADHLERVFFWPAGRRMVAKSVMSTESS